MADPTDDLDPPEDEDATDVAAEDQDDQADEADDQSADAADDGDEAAEDDGGTGAEDPPREQQQTRDRAAPRRGNPEFGRLRRENRDLTRRLEEVERRATQPAPSYDAGAEQRRLQAEEAAREEQVVLTGDPAQIARYYADRSRREVEHQIGNLARNTHDTNDRAAFDRECDSKPTLARLRGKVEQELAKARANGHNPTRSAIARYLLGEQVLQRAPAATTKQQRRADGDRQRQQARPGGTRGDAGGGGGRRTENNSHAARAKRLDESGLL